MGGDVLVPAVGDVGDCKEEVRGARESLDVLSKASGGLLARFCWATSALSSPTDGVVPGSNEEESIVGVVRGDI